MSDPVLDADVVDEDTVPVGPSAAVTVRDASATLSVAPQVQAAELGQRLAVIREAMEQQMIRDVDYGVIPGTKKPSLFKPGAEKLSVLFQLDVQLVNHKTWDGDHLTVESHATVFHAPTGQRLGYGEGLCSTREGRYAKRRLERACPQCGEHSIFESRKDDQPGFYCWKRKGGCGAKFPADDQRILGQEVGERDNPDLPDTWNTVIKMAEKRARVDAILSVTGASALFTQDVEDQRAAGDDGQPAVTEPVLRLASKDEIAAASAALIRLAEGDQARARAAWGELKAMAGGTMPQLVAVTLMTAGRLVDPTAVADPGVQ